MVSSYKIQYLSLLCSYYAAALLCEIFVAESCESVVRKVLVVCIGAVSVIVLWFLFDINAQTTDARCMCVFKLCVCC